MDHADEIAQTRDGPTGAASAHETAAQLPPLRVLPRVRCRHCRRDDRPVWNGVCGWCTARE
jgi:hypothetical protein